MSRQKVSFILVALLLGLFTLVAVTFNQGFFKQSLTTDVKASQNKYIIVVKNNLTPEDLEKFEAHIISSGGKIIHRYTTAFKGFAVSMPEDLVMTMKDDPSVDFVELDQPVNAYTT